MTYEYPMIRIELERMKQTIVAAVTDYNSDIEQHINEELAAVIEHFDYESIVEHAAQEAIMKHVKAYFEWGKGSEYIRKAIEDALDNLFKKEDQ